MNNLHFWTFIYTSFNTTYAELILCNSNNNRLRIFFLNLQQNYNDFLFVPMPFSFNNTWFTSLISQAHSKIFLYSSFISKYCYQSAQLNEISFFILPSIKTIELYWLNWLTNSSPNTPSVPSLFLSSSWLLLKFIFNILFATLFCCYSLTRAIFLIELQVSIKKLKCKRPGILNETVLRNCITAAWRWCFLLYRYFFFVIRLLNYLSFNPNISLRLNVPECNRLLQLSTPLQLLLKVRNRLTQ